VPIKTPLFLKLIAGLCVILSMTVGLQAAGPAVNVSAAANLGPILPGSNLAIVGGNYVSGLSATGTSGQYCVINFTDGGGTQGQANVPLPLGTVPLSIVNKGTGYTSAPTQATLTTGGTASCTQTGSSVSVSTTIGDPLDLNGLIGSVTTSINPVGVTYNPTTETYTGLKISLSETVGPFPGATFSCTGATGVLKLSDSTAGGNDTLKLSNCTFLFGPSPLASLTATLAFAPGVIPAPLPLNFTAPLITGSPNNYSQATYTCLLSSLCQASTGTTASLGISGTLTTSCTSACPSETLTWTGSPGNLTFTAPVGGTPSPQSVGVTTGTYNMAYAITATTTDGHSWLTVPGGGNTGTTGSTSFSVSINTTGLGAGTYTGTIKVYSSDTNTSQPTVPVTLTLTSSPPVITTTSLPAGYTGTPYNQTLAATGGVTPYTWSITTGSLPANLTLNASTGVISGTPTATGTSSFTVQVKDNVGSTATQPLSILINQGVTVTTSSPLPTGEVGVAYSQTLAATGGTGGYTWSVTGGSLPAGLTLSTGGILSGNPSSATTASFTVTAKDSSNNTGSKLFSLTINAGPTITTGSPLPSGTQGVAYNQPLAATGGTSPYTWSLASGTLPANLTLSSSGVISGTPSTPGISNFTVTVTDNLGSASSKPLQLTINGPLTITTTSPLLPGEVGASYSTTLTASGGTGTGYTWSLTSGTMPPGLTLSGGGSITGMPSSTTGSPFSFTVTVMDSGSNTVSKPFSLSVNAGPSITTTSPVPSGELNLSYTPFAFNVVGGTSPYTWSMTSGTLPPGMTLSSAGVLSGTPTSNTGSPFSFTVTVKDSLNSSTSAPFQITIAGALSITTSTLPDGIMGTPYSTSLTAGGGLSPYTWSVSSGSLPAGLTLNTSTGAITGTPTTATSGPVAVGFTVKDSINATANKSLNITILSLLSVTTTTLPNGVLSVSYGPASLAAVGGAPPYTWTLNTGSLPAGLTLTSAGSISGTPTASGTSTFTVTVHDSLSNTANSGSLSIAISSGLTILTTSLPNGTVGTAYSQTMTAAGGTTPYTWSISAGILPPGLTLNTATGAITGTPSVAGDVSFTAEVTDSASNTATQNLKITVVTPPLLVTTSTLPAGTVNVGYSQTLNASGGTPPYSNWKVVSGSLPTGLSLSASSGTISGNPSAAGTFGFSVTVDDSASATSPAKPLSITIEGVLTITTTSLPGGSMGSAYSQTLTANGGLLPYTWSISVGSLPPGLSLNAATGLISGTPSTAGAYPFTVMVKDSFTPTANTATQALSINISTALTITTTSLPGGIVGTAYAQTLAAAGGVTPYTWSITGGGLPAGLTLNASTGLISGNPTTAGKATFTASVKDSASKTATASLSITITTPLTITTSSPLPPGSPAIAYSTTLAASGGTPPYSNWTVSSGTLPPGLSLNAATGVLSGTPTTTTGSPFAFSVTVSDSLSATASKAFTMVVSTGHLTVTPSPITFSLANTAPPSSTTFTVAASDGSAQPFTITQGASTNKWLTLSATGGTTPATITATANPAGLAAGAYTIVLTLNASGLGSTVTAYADLTVTGSNLSASPSMLTFNYQPGAPLPAAQTVNLTTLNGQPVTLGSVTTDSAWLQVTPAATAPAKLQVSVSPGLLIAGNYVGEVIIKSVGSVQPVFVIPVALAVNAEPSLTVAPATLSFTYQIGGTAPAAQTFTVATGDVNLTYSATSPGNWLQVNPSHGPTPGAVTVTAVPTGLPAGTYGGTITVSAVGATNSATVAVTLTVTGSPVLTFSASTLAFTAPVGGPAPAPQTLMVSSSGGPISFTAAAGAAWIGVTPATGTTPATLSVSVNPASLAAGTYSGTVNVTPAGSATPQSVIVTLQVGTVTAPVISGIINAASGAIGQVAPGMAISIFGSDLGPATGVSFALPPPDGTVATTLGGTQVLFDGTPVPVLFAWANQVNALVPFELANKLAQLGPGNTNTVLQVSYGGQTSAGDTLPVVATLPGLFAANGAGTGEGAILNQDSSVNSTSNPAAAGTVIQLFGTGGGSTIPDSIDGALNPLTSTGQLVADVKVTIGGQDAHVSYSGPAPGLVAGVLQINATIPDGTPSGPAAVVVTIGGIDSQKNLTVAVQ